MISLTNAGTCAIFHNVVYFFDQSNQVWRGRRLPYFHNLIPVCKLLPICRPHKDDTLGWPQALYCSGSHYEMSSPEPHKPIYLINHVFSTMINFIYLFINIFIFNTNMHIFTFIHYKDYNTPGNHYNLCLYRWSPLDNTTLNTILNTATFKDHWPHDLHDLAGRRLILLR